MAVAGLVLSVLGGLVGAGAMYYSVTKVRSAATRMTGANNVKQIGLGLHSQHDVLGGFTQYAHDRRGRVYPGSSFRVGLLPYIEQDNLFRQFDLDQSWHSPANRGPSGAPIQTYTSPYDGQTPLTTTP